jgi:hypothetical protein
VTKTFAERLAEKADRVNAARTALTAKHEAEMADLLEAEGHFRGEALAILPEESK